MTQCVIWGGGSRRPQDTKESARAAKFRTQPKYILYIKYHKAATRAKQPCHPFLGRGPPVEKRLTRTLALRGWLSVRTQQHARLLDSGTAGTLRPGTIRRGQSTIDACGTFSLRRPNQPFPLQFSRTPSPLANPQLPSLLPTAAIHSCGGDTDTGRSRPIRRCNDAPVGGGRGRRIGWGGPGRGVGRGCCGVKTLRESGIISARQKPLRHPPLPPKSNAFLMSYRPSSRTLFIYLLI